MRGRAGEGSDYYIRENYFFVTLFSCNISMRTMRENERQCVRTTFFKCIFYSTISRLKTRGTLIEAGSLHDYQLTLQRKGALMKPYVLIPLVIFLFHDGTNASPLPGRSGLEISVSLSANETPVNGYRIFIFEDTRFRDSVFAELALPIYLQFDLNKNYCLKFTKPGFLDRVVLVETKVPAGKEKRKYSYDSEISMLPGDSVNTAGDRPVALIQYDTLRGSFSYSHAYAASVGHVPQIVPAVLPGPADAEVPGKRQGRKKGVLRGRL